MSPQGPPGQSPRLKIEWWSALAVQQLQVGNDPKPRNKPEEIQMISETHGSC